MRHLVDLAGTVVRSAGMEELHNPVADRYSFILSHAVAGKVQPILFARSQWNATLHGFEPETHGATQVNNMTSQL
jgi:hypothetical protein